MKILGLSAFFHDSAACLLDSGEILAAAQEERFSRKKHDPGLPIHAIRYCLKESGISWDDVDAIAFYEQPIEKFRRIINTHGRTFPQGTDIFLAGLPSWLGRQCWIEDELRESLDYQGPIHTVPHHLSHAASAFYPSPYPEAAILTVDGVGEWATTSIGVGRGGKIELLEDIHFPHSLGLLYSAFTSYCGFKVNSGEYKLMGLAPYGEPVYTDLILRELVDLRDDGSFRLNLDYFPFVSENRMFNQAFCELMGGPARMSSERILRRHRDLARSIQEVTNRAMLGLARRARERTGMRHLCLAGGVALNCVANGIVLREGIFEGLWIQPAAGDAGGALGAATALWHQHLGNPRTASGVQDRQQGSLLGPSFDTPSIVKMLCDRTIPFHQLKDGQLEDRVADLLAEEKIVGWFQDRMEFGPRALGSRSILGDPRSPRMQETMNLRIKFRESFRPFAPAVLDDRAREMFDLDHPSPYMLLVAPVAAHHLHPVDDRSDSDENLMTELKGRQGGSDLPAITHVDNSARVQTVSEKNHPAFHRLLTAFHRRHGCPVLVNTSFNIRGEPIVCTPGEALRCFLYTDMDVLVLGNCVLLKEEQTLPLDRQAYIDSFELD